MISVPVSALIASVPLMSMTVRDALSCADAGLAQFGILENPRRLAHFLAQAAHETAGFTRLSENLTYTTPERIKAVWPTRFATVGEARPYVRQPRKLANHVYGGRMGNTRPDDGWHYRGRGLFHLTGRENYRRVSDVLDVDLVKEPERVLDPELLLPVAGIYWRDRRINEMADRNDVRSVTKSINGGFHGLEDRQHWLRRFEAVL